MSMHVGSRCHRVGRGSTAVCVLAGVLLSGCATRSSEPLLTAEQRQLNVASFDEVWTTIRDRHWDPELNGLDWEALRDQYRPRVEAAERMSEARRPMQDLLEELHQTHFAIIPAEAMDDADLAAGDAPSDGGTGMDVRVIDGAVLVTRVVPDSPAARLGISTGWRIVRVGDKRITLDDSKQNPDDSHPVSESVRFVWSIEARLTGRVGETVEVEFLNGMDRPIVHEIELAPRRGKRVRVGLLPSFYIWFESRRLADDIGYVAFSAFMDPMTVMGRFNESMTEFMDASGIIIDLRGNPGGIGAMAMGMAGWFVPDKRKQLGTMHTRQGELHFVVNPRPKVYEGPLVILVDEMTGSTAEIFAGGMKDLDRATIVGSRTAGAALPAQMKPLPNGDGLLYAVANYVSAAGDVLEGKGVIPDKEVMLSREALLAGRDPGLETGVAVIRKGEAQVAQVVKPGH